MVEEHPPTPPEHPTLSSGLLIAVQQMDSDAWSRLVNTFGPIVYRWCRASGVKDADAADIVQEVFVSVARGIATFERKKAHGSFRAWLATITRNRVRDHLRRALKTEQAAGGSEAQQHLMQQAETLESTICAEGIEKPLIRGQLEAVRAEFEPTTWEAFWRCVVDDQRAADVAASLGLSLASVYQAKSRVLRRLRQRITDIPI